MASSPLGTLERIVLISLQKGPRHNEMGGFCAKLPAFNLAPEIADFTDSAAIIDNLDLVLSVDTAITHLCGAMAKRIWLLLPFALDWRWAARGATTVRGTRQCGCSASRRRGNGIRRWPRSSSGSASAMMNPEVGSISGNLVKRTIWIYFCPDLVPLWVEVRGRDAHC
jgi:hypothetical protein